MPEPCKMVGVKPSLAADAQADTMHRNGEPFGEMPELRQRSTAIAHIVFGMDFQPCHRGGIFQDGLEMLWLVAHAGCGRQMCRMAGCIKHDGPRSRNRNKGYAGCPRIPFWCADQAGRSRSSGSSDPLRSVPSAIAGRSISEQVPWSTSVQAFP